MEESKRSEKEVSSTENISAAACVGFGTEIENEMEGRSMGIGREVSIRLEDLPSVPVKKKYAKIVTQDTEQEVRNGGNWRFLK